MDIPTGIQFLPYLLKDLIHTFRRHRPRMVFTHPVHDRHPDHEACASLVREAAFKAGLAKFPAPGTPR